MRLSCCFALLGAAHFAQAQDVELPHTFQAGTPARAAEVNANFAALADAVNAHGAVLASVLGEPQEVGTFSIQSAPYSGTAIPIYGIQWSGTFDFGGGFGGGGSAGASSFGGVKVFKSFDLLSPQLLIDFATGTRFPSATIVVSSGGSVVATFALESIYIRELGATSSNGNPLETVELGFEIIRLSVEDSTTGDSAAACFNLKLNSSC